MDSARRRTVRQAHTVAASLVIAGLLALAIPAAHARTYVIPHVIEQSGTIATPYHFDHNLYALYGSGLAGTTAGEGATLSLYLYDNTAGAPLKNNGIDVCNPCFVSLGPPVAARKVSLGIEDLVLATGAFDANVKLGFGVIVVGGDAAGVSLESTIVNSHSSIFDASSLTGAPIRLRAEDPAAPDATVFQITHVMEMAGKTSNTQYTFDHTIHATYTAGLAGTPAGAGATVDLYLLDNTGNAPLKNQGANVCNPCSYALGGANPRKRSITIDDLITASGAFDATVKLGAAVLVVTGDAGNVTLQALSTNAHTNPFDLAFAYPAIAPVQINETLSADLGTRPGVVMHLAASPSPASGEVRFAVELAHAAEVELSIFDVAGRKVATVYQGRLAAGPSVCRWDGSGASGAVGGGMYFARLSSPDGSSQARLVMRP
jgi:hypothetical protein